MPKIPERQAWSFAGPFGIYDTAQLQRGYKIYREVCSNCHSMIDMNFRNLADPGGPEFTEGQVEALAASFKVPGRPESTTARCSSARAARPIPFRSPSPMMRRHARQWRRRCRPTCRCSPRPAATSA